MKITFIKPIVSQNGGSRVVAIHAQKLIEMGHDVTVVSRLPQTKTPLRAGVDLLKGRYKPADPNRTAYYDALKDNHVQIPWKYPLVADDVPDADIVIATWWRTAYEVADLPPEKGKKVYFVQGHEVFFDHNRDLAAGSYYLPLTKITISQWLVDIMANEYGDHNVAKVPNAVDTDHFDAPPRARNATPTVGLIYSPSEVKGTDIALKAIAKLKETHPDLKVVAFGSDKPVASLPLPAGSRFKQLPSQTEIVSLYSAADVWICSSRTEGFGLPILEALACRTPVVATRTGAAEDLITDGQNGYVVDVGDHAALADRLADILNLSPDDWRTVSDAAYARARSFSWDDAASAFEAELVKIHAQ